MKLLLILCSVLLIFGILSIVGVTRLKIRRRSLGLRTQLRPSLMCQMVIGRPLQSQSFARSASSLATQTIAARNPLRLLTIGNTKPLTPCRRLGLFSITRKATMVAG